MNHSSIRLENALEGVLAVVDENVKRVHSGFQEGRDQHQEQPCERLRPQLAGWFSTGIEPDIGTTQSHGGGWLLS